MAFPIRLIALPVTALGLVLLATPAPAGPSDAASGVLETQIATVSRLAGGEPQRCVFAGPEQALCAWEVEGRLLQGDDAEPADPTEPIQLICEVPLDQDEASEPRCRAHARGARKLPPVAASRPAAQSPLETLAHARTVAELSHQLGEIPETCRTGAGQQRCTWTLSIRSLGAERLGMSDEDASGVMVRCSLPLDGRPRAEGSCFLSRVWEE